MAEPTNELIRVIVYIVYTDMPRVQLVLGRNLSPDHIREGIDVYFDCHVEARPSAVRLVWRHQVRENGISASPEDRESWTNWSVFTAPDFQAR